MVRGYMLFAADTPLIGLDPHPAYAPDEAPDAFGADVWARLYHVSPDRAGLEREALEDLEAARQAVEEGDLEDWSDEPDEVFPVTVSDAGVLTVMDPDGQYVMAEYSPADVYGAFGMSCPEVLPDQRAAAWALVRDHLDGLAAQFGAFGVACVETEYLQEDGIAGLQEIAFISADGAPIDADTGSLQLPPVVSRGEHGQVRLVPVEGPGTLAELAETVFESVAECVLNDPGAVIDRIGIRLSADGSLTVETEGQVVRPWTPPAATAPADTPEP